MEHRPFRSIRANTRVMIAIITVLLMTTLVAVVPAIAGHGVRSASAYDNKSAGTGPNNNKGAATGLGQLSGLLPRDHLTEESAIQVDLSNETVRMPLYPGEAHGQKVRYILLDASDAELAHDLA